MRYSFIAKENSSPAGSPARRISYALDNKGHSDIVANIDKANLRIKEILLRHKNLDLTLFSHTSSPFCPSTPSSPSRPSSTSMPYNTSSPFNTTLRAPASSNSRNSVREIKESARAAPLLASERHQRADFTISLLPCLSGSEPFKEQILSCLSTQIQLDSLLRTAKSAFNLSKDCPALCLELESAKLPAETIDSLRPSYEEIDPLAGEAQFCSAQKLVSAYVKAEQHWKERFSLERSEAEQLFAMLSLGEGKASVESGVAFLNFELGTFFRKRDLLLIFRRMGATSITKPAFMEALCTLS